MLPITCAICNGRTLKCSNLVNEDWNWWSRYDTGIEKRIALFLNLTVWTLCVYNYNKLACLVVIYFENREVSYIIVLLSTVTH